MDKNWVFLVLALGFILLGSFVFLILRRGLTGKVRLMRKDCLTLKEVERTTDKCLVVYDNKVYDVTGGVEWSLTGHVGGHPCGQVYEKVTIEEGPHKVEVMDKFYLTKLCEEE